MLSDILFDVYSDLKTDYLHYTKDPKDYSKCVRDEVEHILEGLNVLCEKFDSSLSNIPYVGTGSYDDGGAYQRWKIATKKCNAELIRLAGDLSKEEEPQDYFSAMTKYNKTVYKAMGKLKRERLEELKSLYKKYNDELEGHFKK